MTQERSQNLILFFCIVLVYGHVAVFFYALFHWLVS